ncbi:MAG: hypothetical protein FJX76_06785 [Armatimonadetes bacterium]|nr:hypothetical protein [Armatimonadota bacterium]
MAGAWALAVDALMRKTVLAGLVAALAIVLGGTGFVRERLDDWRASTAVVAQFRALYQEHMGAFRDVAVVDFPDRFTPRDDVRWPAYMFISAFNDGAIFHLSGGWPTRVHLWRSGPESADFPVVATEQAPQDPGTDVWIVRYNAATHRLESTLPQEAR